MSAIFRRRRSSGCAASTCWSSTRCSTGPHPSHLSLGEALDWIERLKPKNAVLTHMHVPLDYDTVMAETPEHVEPAYDGMMIEIPYELT